jgi:exodeoxyribonuclease VII large subunit
MRGLFDEPLKESPEIRGGDPAARERRRVYTVSELNALAHEVLEEAFPSIWVEGEISNLRKYPSGHTYFTLKDASAQISAVLFRGAAQSLPFRPEDGLKVLARGRVSLYEARGTFQIVVETLEPAGLGALQLAYEQLKARLLEEGLFDPARKRPLPALPRRIGIVASLQGAALRDILKVLARRFANLEVVIAPSRVQGEGASFEIVESIRMLNRLGGVDVLILARGGGSIEDLWAFNEERVARGGGSIEDLWAFNEERVARAIASSAIPVVSAVGHEVDTTIADLVADLRAPTPSAAAEMVVRSKEEMADGIRALEARLSAAVRLRLSAWRETLDDAGSARAREAVRDRLHQLALRVDDLTSRLGARLEKAATESRHRLDLLRERMTPERLGERLRLRRARADGYERLLRASMTARLQRAGDQCSAYAERLQALSPLAVLSRGYAICRLTPAGAILKDAAEARAGDAVHVRLHRGGLRCAVTEVRTHGEIEDGL